MFAKFEPTWLVEAIYQITPEQLRELGIKAVLTDLDNTLIAWNNPDGTPELLDWIKTMREAEIPVVVVSNNRASRIERVVKHLGLSYVARAMKPLTKGFKEAEKILGLQPSEMIMVGDQIMTDIRGANAAGIRTALVKPVVETDGWNTRINRFMERHVVNHLQKKTGAWEWKEGLK